MPAVTIPAELFGELGDAITQALTVLDEVVEQAQLPRDREARNELEATWALTRLALVRGVEWDTHAA